ncbi:unnamed protein product [Caenorhabditis auriculariae]|uniref:G protein-coupled receptor n=1 Tax=Caenorhabditis auriculariae TaxID=2777116 RepID=A0A8S1GQ29_9PELO|nr:unnamed protein product [Caenorhabditis auriculariae]
MMLNVAAFCSILFLSPKAMKNYKWLLLNYQACVMMMDIIWPLMVTPYLYLPVMGGCSIGWFQTIGIPIDIQFAIGCMSFTSVQSAVLVLFEYRHHNVLPAKSALRFKTKFRVIFLIAQYIFFCACVIVPVMIEPVDQYASKIEAIEVSIPMLFICVPLATAVLLEKNESSPQTVPLLIVIFVSIHGAISSIFTILSNRHYRSYFLRLPFGSMKKLLPRKRLKKTAHSVSRSKPNCVTGVPVMIMDILFMVMLTPYFYLPVMGGCSIGWFQAIGIPVHIQTAIGFVSLASASL